MSKTRRREKRYDDYSDYEYESRSRKKKSQSERRKKSKDWDNFSRWFDDKFKEEDDFSY